VKGRTWIAVGVVVAGMAGTGGCRTRTAPAGSTPVAAVRADVPQIFVDISMVRVDQAAVEALLGEPQPIAASTRRTMSAAEADALLERLKALPGADFVAAPKILALAGQHASMFVGESSPQPDGLTYAVEEDLERVGSHGLSLSIEPRLDRASPRLVADLRFAWKSPEGAATEPLTRSSARLVLSSTERAVWSVPVASSRPGARERIVLVVSMRLLEV
jgi:hypothetical protein